jgi:hypothetical protein
MEGIGMETLILRQSKTQQAMTPPRRKIDDRTYPRKPYWTFVDFHVLL